MRAEDHWADYRTVAVYGSVPDAERARGLLESDGIVAAVQDGLCEPRRQDFLCVRLLVPATDLARARDLLSPIVAVPEPAPEPPPPLESDATWTVAWLALLAAAGAALLAAFTL